MFNEKMQEALNAQINAEMYSSYLYLSMSSYAIGIGLNGFANWLRIQAQEELAHAMRFYDYMNERGGKVLLHEIKAPQTDWASVIAMFEDVVKHENYVTSLINELVNLAIQEKDHATQILLQWFVSEQVEEEATSGNIFQQLKLTGTEGSGLFMIDRELAQRVFVPPVFTP